MKSKKVAKYIILVLLLLISMNDLIDRRLINDNHNVEQRIWCNSSHLQIYNSIRNIFDLLSI